MFRQGVEFFECDSSQEHTMCCGKGDECRSDGLCNSVFYGLVFRNGCSDPTWQSPHCAKLCDSGSLSISVWNGEVKDLTNTGVPVKLCGDGSYCCGDGATADNCCASKQGVFVRNGSAIPHYQVPSSAITVPISTIVSTLAESYSVTTTVTTTLSSESPSGSIIPESETASANPSSPTSSSANKSLDMRYGAIMGGTTIGGGVLVVLVLLFGNWRRLWIL